MTRLDDLIAELRDFSTARDWDQFHTPKNLAMALAGEVGELVAELQWLSEEQIRTEISKPDLRERVSDEAADVLLYLLRFADVSGIDLTQAAFDKLARNELRYPVDRAKGSAAKYNRL